MVKSIAHGPASSHGAGPAGMWGPSTAYVVAVAFSCFVFLAYGYKLPPDAKEFLYQALPQWIQAFGVAIGAYYVYKWREQEQSKTRAKDAGLWLKNVISTTKLVRETRATLHYPAEIDVSTKFISNRVDEFMPKLQQMSSAGEKLLEHVDIAEETFGKKVANNLRELRAIVFQMRLSNDLLRMLVNKPELMELAKFNHRLRRHLADIDVVLWDHERPGVYNDEVNDRIHDCEQKLRKSLANIMKLQT